MADYASRLMAGSWVQGSVLAESVLAEAIVVLVESAVPVAAYLAADSG